MKYIKAFELLLTRKEIEDKIKNYQKYTGKWVIIKSLYNYKFTIAEFKRIEKDNYVYLFFPKNSPFDVGGYCGIPISDFEILDSCDNKKDTEEMLNNVKIREASKKYNL